MATAKKTTPVSAKAAAGKAKKVASVKKAPAKKIVNEQPVAHTASWNTIHVFGYGESQVIGKVANGKVANSELIALEPLFAALAQKQQKGTKVSLVDTHVLTIFNGALADYRPRSPENKGQRFAWADIDSKAVNKLAGELISKAPEAPRRNFMDILIKNRTVHAPSKKAPVKKNTAKK